MSSPRLVFCPGLACDERLWAAQMPIAPSRLRAVVTDVHTRHPRVDAMADALLHEYDGPLVLCGASMGGMLAMEVARRAPERVVGLALLGTNARPETPDMFELRESAIALFERGDARLVIEANAHIAFHPAQAADAPLLKRYVDMVLDAGADQLIAQNRAVMHRPDAREHLPALKCPVLVMCGDGDALTPPECSREIVSLVPQAELVMVPECGHMLTMEKPALVNDVLLRWLQRFVA
jgi:pimeloyl-ACP methyl ester carboxylesterase